MTPTEIPPPIARQGWQYPCRTVFPVVSQTIAATPPLLSLQMANRNPKTDLTRGVSQRKLASEAYRAIGGVARNSISNRAIVAKSDHFAHPYRGKNEGKGSEERVLKARSKNSNFALYRYDLGTL